MPCCCSASSSAIDAICVEDSEGKRYSTDFYVKIHRSFCGSCNSSTQGSRSCLRPDLDDNNNGGEEYLQLPKDGSVVDDNLLSSNSEVSLRLSPKESKQPELFEVSCNGTPCPEIRCVVGDGGALLFLEPNHLVSGDMGVTTTPSSTLLKSFPFNRGQNILICKHIALRIELEFSVWLFSFYDRLVVMDIDGTVTRSDIRGYIETVLCGIYTFIHPGIAKLLSILVQCHGFHIIYVTSRPLRHIHQTRSFISNVCDDDGHHRYYLPSGPIFLNRESLWRAAYRELITRQTIEFKSATLMMVADVFKAAQSSSRTLDNCAVPCAWPFVLGIGNRKRDAVAYHSVGIPEDNILLIDSYSRLVQWTALNCKGKNGKRLYNGRVFSGYNDPLLVMYMELVAKSHVIMRDTDLSLQRKSSVSSDQSAGESHPLI